MAQLVNRPLVSVVTPFFNTAPYLAECIESVLAQSYSHFEYILLDNCSTDGSSEIAAAYASRDSRIRLIRCSAVSFSARKLQSRARRDFRRQHVLQDCASGRLDFPGMFAVDGTGL